MAASNQPMAGLWRDVLKRGFCIFERQVLVFPLLVVMLACVSFLFGGKCAAWQWWTGVAIVVTVPFAVGARHDGGGPPWRVGTVAAGFFAVVLLTVKCLLPPLFWDNATVVDMSVYHLPMAQLLAEGWNPVQDPLAEGIMGVLGLDYWGMASSIVVFYSKAMAVFAGVAYHFVGDPTGLTIPGIAFLWLGAALPVLRLFKGFVRWAAFFSTVVVLPMVVNRLPVDLEVAFASCGLLWTMQDGLRKKGCDWISLGVWGAWMMNLKHNGVLGAFAFFAVFTIAKCWKERQKWHLWLARFAVSGAVLVALWGLISWNPLVTSWKAYGHPLYPFMTADEERFPRVDLAGGPLKGNEDAQFMGKAGAMLHAYVSPRLAESWYRRKSGREDFHPWRPWWSWGEFPNKTTRVALWGLFLVLFVFPRGRCWGLCGLLLLFAVPNDQVGFTRYLPWLSALGCLAVVLVAEYIDNRVGKRRTRMMSGCLLAVLAGMAATWGWQHARNVNYKARELDLGRERIRPLLWVSGRGTSSGEKPIAFSNGVPSGACNYLTCMLNRTRLLVKQMGRNGKTSILPTTGMRQDLGFDWVERDWPDIAGKWRRSDTNAFSRASWKEYNVWEGMSDDCDVEAWMREPADWYWVPVDESAAHIIKYYSEAEPREGETASGRLWRRMKYCAKVWGLTYPHEVWRWLIGQKGQDGNEK